jgi:hypothetical protein
VLLLRRRSNPTHTFVRLDSAFAGDQEAVVRRFRRLQNAIVQVARREQVGGGVTRRGEGARRGGEEEEEEEQEEQEVEESIHRSIPEQSSRVACESSMGELESSRV